MKALEKRILAMCKELLPKTTQSDNKKLKQLLDDIEESLK